MANFTWAEIWAAILAVASALVLLSNAAEKIAKAVQTAKAPNARQDERLDLDGGAHGVRNRRLPCMCVPNERDGRTFECEKPQSLQGRPGFPRR